MQLYIVRHGQSIGNLSRDYIAGRSDTQGLTQKGKNQIIRTAWELQERKIDCIFSSPVVRAQESASIIGSALGLKISPLLFLEEWNYGEIEGRRWSEVGHLVPKEFRQHRWGGTVYYKEDYSHHYPGGESLEMLARRVWNGLDAFVREHDSDKTYVLVSHMAVISTIMYCAEKGGDITHGGYADEYVSRIHTTGVPNASIADITWRNGKFSLNSVQVRFPPLEPEEKPVRFYSAYHLEQPDLKVEYKKTSSVTNEVFHLTNGETRIFKLLYDQETVRAQRLSRLYEYVHTIPAIPAPRILYSDTSQVFFSHPVLIQDFLEGMELGHCLERHEICVRTLFGKLHSIVASIHSIPTADVEEFWLPDDWDSHDHDTWDSFMIDQISQTVEKIGQMGELVSVYPHVASQLEELKTHIASSKDSFVPIHGDLAQMNIIVSPHSDRCDLVRILDFERAQIGDRLWDYAYFYGWLRRSYPDSAGIWKETVWGSMSEQEQKAFDQYHLLFHAWTVRDGATYAGNMRRKELAERSIEIIGNEKFKI